MPGYILSPKDDPPKDAPRRWPTGFAWDKYLEEAATRPIRVRITTYRGTCPDATHFKVEVKEKKNSWWDAEQDAWVELYSDLAGAGMDVHGSLPSYNAALDVAIAAIKAIAGKKDARVRPLDWMCSENDCEVPTKVLKALGRKAEV